MNPTQAPRYLYDYLGDGRLLWLASDRLVLTADDGKDGEILFEAEVSPIPYPVDEIARLTERQAGLDPPLFMNVPEYYQLAQHLNVDEDGEIWLYLTSIERSGLLHLSAGGDELGFHAVIAEFDLMAARITMAGGRVYFMVPGREGTAIYSADLP